MPGIPDRHLVSAVEIEALLRGDWMSEKCRNQTKEKTLCATQGFLAKILGMFFNNGCFTTKDFWEDWSEIEYCFRQLASAKSKRLLARFCYFLSPTSLSRFQSGSTIGTSFQLLQNRNPILIVPCYHSYGAESRAFLAVYATFAQRSNLQQIRD